jgi:hypothetical protein
MCKISEDEKKLIEKLPMKYGISNSIGTLVDSQNNIFNCISCITQHISTDPQKAITTKQHEAQMSKIHKRVTNEKALHKQSMLQQKELQVELGSTTFSMG